MANGGGSIADMIVQEKRGTAMASFSIGPLLGPIIGPIIGGVVTDSLGWRWVFWIITIISGTITVIFFIFAVETYAPVILEHKTRRLRKATGNDRLRSKLDAGLSPADYFKRGILRPFKMLLFSPICIICGLYVGLSYAYLYLMFTSLTPLFMRIYHFNTVNSGLTFLGLGIGSMIGVIYFSISSDRNMKKMAAKAQTSSDEETGPTEQQPVVMKPEYRLPPLRVGAIFLPAGLFIYGWTAEYKVHWIAPIIGTAVMGVGNLIIFMVSPQLSQCSLTVTNYTYRPSKCISSTASPSTQPQPSPPTPSCVPSPVVSFLLLVYPCLTSWAWAGETVCWASSRLLLSLRLGCLSSMVST